MVEKIRQHQLVQKHQDKIMYFGVGILAFVVDSFTFFLLRKLNLSIGLSNIGAMLAGMITSFSLNWRVVFKNKHYQNSTWLMILIFLTLNALNWWFSTSFIKFSAPLISQIINDVIKLNISESFCELIAKVFSISLMMIWNFIIYKKIIFKEKASSQVEA